MRKYLFYLPACVYIYSVRPLMDAATLSSCRGIYIGYLYIYVHSLYLFAFVYLFTELTTREIKFMLVKPCLLITGSFAPKIYGNYLIRTGDIGDLWLNKVLLQLDFSNLEKNICNIFKIQQIFRCCLCNSCQSSRFLDSFLECDSIYSAVKANLSTHLFRVLTFAIASFIL